MGCFHSKLQSTKRQRKNSTKAYSWDNKEKVNPKDFTIENLKEETTYKLPGSVNGQQFIIQNCEDLLALVWNIWITLKGGNRILHNSSIHIFDHINTVTVDDCNNCNVFLGPTKGSVFLRDCKDCRFAIACQQFRSRDCGNIDVFLCCATQPIIESCYEMRFGCFCYNYNDLDAQMKKASLSVFNNNWNNIHDFTPVETEENWSLLPKDAKVEQYLPVPVSDEVSSLHIRIDPDFSIVPQTQVTDNKIHDENCLVVFFPDGQAQKRALSYIQKLAATTNVLTQTKEVKLEEDCAERIFGADSYNAVVMRGSVFALHYTGKNCISICQEQAKAIATETGSTGLVYVSSTAKTAFKQIEMLFNYADIQMSV